VEVAYAGPIDLLMCTTSAYASMSKVSLSTYVPLWGPHVVPFATCKSVPPDSTALLALLPKLLAIAHCNYNPEKIIEWPGKICKCKRFADLLQYALS
jgi:hypothetical protein